MLPDCWMSWKTSISSCDRPLNLTGCSELACRRCSTRKSRRAGPDALHKLLGLYELEHGRGSCDGGAPSACAEELYSTLRRRARQRAASQRDTSGCRPEARALLSSVFRLSATLCTSIAGNAAISWSCDSPCSHRRASASESAAR